MTKYFTPFTEDVFIPSVKSSLDGKEEVIYTKVSKDLMNEAVLKGWMSSSPIEER